MHLGLYEISVGGHHGAYAKAIAREAVRRSWKVTLVIPQSDRNHPTLREISALIGPKNIVLTPFFSRPFGGGGKAALLAHHFEQRRAAVRSLALLDRNCEFVYTSNLGYMDKAMIVMGSPSRVPIGGMCMRVRFHMSTIEGHPRGPASLLGELQLRRLASTSGVTCVTTADPALFHYCQAEEVHLRTLGYVPELGMDPPGNSNLRRKTKAWFQEREHAF